MTPDWFPTIDFDDASYEEHFQRVHDPDEGYEYIQYLNDTLNPDTDIHDYARVDLFRATMQYTEEFLIYLLSYINTEDDFVEDLIRNQVRIFCEQYADDTPGDYFDAAGVQFDDRLKAVFGYTDLLAADDPASRLAVDLSNDEIEARVTESIDTIHTQLTGICRYYLDFIDIYNATKHGNKFQLSSAPTLELTEDYVYDADQTFATFLCKRSGDTATGEPYLSTYSLDRLVNRSLTIAADTHQLFSYLDTVVEERLDDTDTQTRRFFLTAETAEEADSVTADPGPETPDIGQTIEIWNRDSKLVLPKTEDLAAFGTDPVTDVAMRVAIDNGTVHVTTAGATERSAEYPLLGTIDYRSRPGPRLGIEYEASFEITLIDLDIRQYYELLKFDHQGRNDELTELVIDFEDRDLEITEPIDGLEPPPVSRDVEDETLFENLALAQQITQTRLPLPPTFLDGQAELISAAVEGNPGRDEVADAIAEARAIGEDVEVTHVLADPADGDGPVQGLHVFQGFLEAAFDTDESDAPETLREAVEAAEAERVENVLRFTELPGSYSQFLEEIETLGIAPLIVSRPPSESADSDDTFSIAIDIEYNAQTFWYDLHRVIIRRTD